MKTWWKSVSSRIRGAMALAAFVVTVVVVFIAVPVVTCEEEAEAGPSIQDLRQEWLERSRQEQEEQRQEWERREQENEDRWTKMEAEERAFRIEFEAEQAKQPPPKQRRVRRFRWESPAETRGKVWNIPEEESEDALVTALLRVCIAEADGDPQDCAGIWQVVKNNRRRSCDRKRILRITECDENGETYLSALRRHQRHALGMIKAHNRRGAWVRNLTPDCGMPEGYPRSENHWNAYYGSKICPQTVADVRMLVDGKLPVSRPGHRVRWLPGRPITWGGRCESGRASCDDRIACSRGLARLQGVSTINAFWCRIGSRGCRSDPEPICIALGYGNTAEANEAEVKTSGG